MKLYHWKANATDLVIFNETHRLNTETNEKKTLAKAIGYYNTINIKDYIDYLRNIEIYVTEITEDQNEKLFSEDPVVREIYCQLILKDLKWENF